MSGDATTAAKLNDREALRVAVEGLRELEDLYEEAYQAADAGDGADDPHPYRQIRQDLSRLLDRIGGTR